MLVRHSATALTIALVCTAPAAVMATFERLSPIQFLAADPGMTQSASGSGTGAATWGIWRADPGPRGFNLERFAAVEAAGGAAPGGWQFDRSDWWLEEHGLVMPPPTFPVPDGRYMVTGGRETTAMLTLRGDEWALEGSAALRDVTHLPCRSARYSPLGGPNATAPGSPADVDPHDFPVAPGAPMPPVPGCTKQDYAVLFVTAIDIDTNVDAAAAPPRAMPAPAPEDPPAGGGGPAQRSASDDDAAPRPAAARRDSERLDPPLGDAGEAEASSAAGGRALGRAVAAGIAAGAAACLAGAALLLLRARATPREPAAGYSAVGGRELSQL